jgi:predicted transcriptional regulator
MVALPRELRERVSEIARESSLSESRIAQELIARALGRKSLLSLPGEVSR